MTPNELLYYLNYDKRQASKNARNEELQLNESTL